MRRKSSRRRRGAGGSVYLVLGAGAVGGIAVALAGIWRLPWLLAYLAAVNAVDFLLYGGDKAMSKVGLLRVPERTLHLFDLAGGSPGGLVAQQVFRHKTAKVSFRRTFWLIAAAQAVLVAWAVWRYVL